MKSIINIKTLLLTGLLLPMMLLQSCLKSKNSLTNFTDESTQPVVEIPEGGLGTFASQALNVSGLTGADTIWFHINLASTDFLNKDVTVKFGYDANALTTYNSSHSIQYTKFPDSIFKFPVTQVTIKAGTRAVAVPLIVYPDKIDPTQNYMFPVTITDAQGTTISGNFGTVWFHLIGNPLAGTYNWDFTRWPNPQKSGSPDIQWTDVTVLSPVSPTQLEVQSGYYIGPRYEITFDNNGGVLSNFQVTMNADDVATMKNNGVIITNGPNILIADPVNKIFEFQYTTLTRYVIDKYYK